MLQEPGGSLQLPKAPLVSSCLLSEAVLFQRLFGRIIATCTHVNLVWLREGRGQHPPAQPAAGLALRQAALQGTPEVPTVLGSSPAFLGFL